jgi:hypothetical protein
MVTMTITIDKTITTYTSGLVELSVSLPIAVKIPVASITISALAILDESNPSGKLTVSVTGRGLSVTVAIGSGLELGDRVEGGTVLGSLLVIFDPKLQYFDL